MARSFGDELGVSRCHGMGGNQVLHKMKKFVTLLILVAEFDCRHLGTGIPLRNYSRHWNRPFLSSFEPHYESEASCIVFIMKSSSFVCKQK